MPKELISLIAKEIGFSDIKFIAAKPLLESENKFLKWRDKGYAADMNYLLKENPINARPHALLEEARTLIMLTANYYSPCPPRPSLEHGRIAAYAAGLDYHKVLKQKIQDLINHPELKPIFVRSKFFTDAVPLLEKSFAKKSGLGFRGRNTLLISKETGSFNFICEILTDLDLNEETEDLRHCEEHEVRRGNPASSNSGLLRYAADDDLEREWCGKCTRCLDICPTNALPEPYQLDARKCISYHTIENRGEIPKELRNKFGEWFFGCDLCQTICPYNRKNIPLASFPEFSPQAGFGHWFYLPEILDLKLGTHNTVNDLINALESHKFIDPQALPIIKNFLAKQTSINEEVLDHIFQIKFARTALLRPKRLGLIRNAEIVLFNSRADLSKLN